MKIFFFGGTFDPPHLGHQKIVRKCIGKCDQFIIIPNNKSPHKKNIPVVDCKHREEMLRILFDDPKILIDLFEINSKKINYTIHTIKYLKEKYDNASLTMILGYDNFLDLNNWYNYNDIIENVNIIFFNRKVKISSVTEIDFLNRDNIQGYSDFNYDISSSKIRKLIKESNDEIINKFLDQKIINYIKENRLYD